jgi:hypothetical protein
MTPADRSRIAILTLFVLAAPARAAQVWVVAPTPGPGVDFTSVQAAVAAAAVGDIVLVRPAAVGAYGGDIQLGGKALTIVADGGAQVPTIASFGRVTVSGLAAGQTTVLRGFELPGMGFWPVGSDEGTLGFKNSPGTLLVEDCSITGTQSAVRATTSGWLGIANSNLVGSSYSFGESAVVGAGLANVATTTTLHGSTSRGGPGQFMVVMANPIGLAGSAGAQVWSGTLVAARSTLLGGDGAGSTFSSYFSTCVYSSGGNGLALASQGLLAHLLDTTMTAGGAGALNAPCTAPPTIPGLDSGGATWTAPDGAAPVLYALPVTREGQALSAVLDTSAGDFAVLLVATSVQPLFYSEFHGPLLNPAASVLALGTVPPSGTVTSSATIQELGAGVEGVSVYLQGASVDPATISVRLSNVSVAVLVDASL